MSFGIWRRWAARLNGTFIPLLVALLIGLVIAPIAEGWPLGAALLVAYVLLTGIFAIHDQPLLRRIMAAALALVMGLRGLAHVYGEQHRELVVLAHLAIAAYLLLLYVICVSAVLRREQITRDTVLGAICGYILIAYVFAFGYAALGDVRPTSFSSTVVLPDYDGARIGHGTPELLYYSFVTLTTVGYGDIIPANRAARSLAVLEMLAGQLYLAGFVARLVGVMAARPPRPGDPRERNKDEEGR
jgi:voltage-gated potassium channel